MRNLSQVSRIVLGSVLILSNCCLSSIVWAKPSASPSCHCKHKHKEHKNEKCDCKGKGCTECSEATKCQTGSCSVSDMNATDTSSSGKESDDHHPSKM